MKTIEIPTDDPLKMIWAIREKIYEETKDMTDEEEREYTRKKVESFQRRLAAAQPDENEFPFLSKKKM
jgi:hypothetical protein